MDRDSFNPISNMWIRYSTLNVVQLLKEGRTNTGQEKNHRLGFPGGAVVKSPPANAGDMGSSPGPGRSHMLRSNWARAPQLLSLCSRACEPQLLSP